MIIPGEHVEPAYFRWLFKSPDYIKALQSTSDLIRDGQALRFSNFAAIPLIKFSKEEQLEIANYLSDKTTKIDAQIKMLLDEIQLLIEYRTSLISEVVTGKLDIRGIEIEDFVEEPTGLDNLEEDVEADDDFEEAEEVLDEDQ
ncbi:hypothetical protein E4K68_17185 [Desulfosporosinus sp. Sb-LF]|nr:hypothetical protein E4K68_17185 [Desulfosporosinus sp. Sb-LF]